MFGSVNESSDSNSFDGRQTITQLVLLVSAVLPLAFHSSCVLQLTSRGSGTLQNVERLCYPFASVRGSRRLITPQLTM